MLNSLTFNQNSEIGNFKTFQINFITVVPGLCFLFGDQVTT